MTSTQVRSKVDHGWWAVDVAGYLLTRLEALPGGAKAPSIEPDAVVGWIRRNELDWAPGCPDLAETIPWRELDRQATDADLVCFVLDRAVKEVNRDGAAGEGGDWSCSFAARRQLPMSTLHAFGYPQPDPPGSNRIDYADGHVHQGAALPLEVTVHWIASRFASIARESEAPPRTSMKDTNGVEFNPAPLLLLLRHIVESPEPLDQDLLELAVAAAKCGSSAWDELGRRIGFDDVSAAPAPTAESVLDLKEQALDDDKPRLVAMLRIESILHAALTQRQPGLDVFVDVFEQLASMRRGRLGEKALYFEKSIENHRARSQKQVHRLELRLGEPVAKVPANRAGLEKDYADALTGYRNYLDRAFVSKDPVLVTFPLSLVKSVPDTPTASDHWRYNPRGIYELTEVLLDVFDAHPDLVPFVDGIDVCGWEEGEPNWLFAPAFERFAAATAGLAPPPACRFHAGEWQWTPLSGLRRIAEFLRFQIPAGTPRRIGHGLAMSSRNWRRIAEQPVDELLDDLVWARERLAQLDCTAALERATERLILDLRPFVYADQAARDATVPELIEAYGARFDADSLEAISFLRRCRGRLRFPDLAPAPRRETRLHLLATHLSAERPDPPAVGEVVGTERLESVSIHSLQSILDDLYNLLAPEVIADVRWSGTLVEACPSSNVMAGGVRGLEEHPMRDLVADGLLVTVNSDDPSLFHSSIADEHAHDGGGMGFPHGQLRRSRQLGLGVVAPALATDRLRESLERALSSLEDR